MCNQSKKLMIVWGYVGQYGYAAGTGQHVLQPPGRGKRIDEEYESQFTPQ